MKKVIIYILSGQDLNCLIQILKFKVNNSSSFNQNENDLSHTIKQYLNRFHKLLANNSEEKSSKRDMNLLHRRLFSGLNLICHKYSNVYLHYSFDV